LVDACVGRTDSELAIHTVKNIQVLADAPALLQDMTARYGIALSAKLKAAEGSKGAIKCKKRDTMVISYVQMWSRSQVRCAHSQTTVGLGKEPTTCH
jgi:hypothetical protein